MQKKIVSPRIREESKGWYQNHFPSLNAGVTFAMESFPELYKRALLEIRGKFSREELLLIVDVYNATALTPGMPMLEAQVGDGIALDYLDQKWGVEEDAIENKILSLTSFQSAALELWANGYWYAHPTKKLRDLEKYVEELT